MSALPPKADMCSAHAHVCFGPKADITASFDRFVGTGEYCRRNDEAQCLSGLEVDNQLVLGRRLHWQVGGLLALRDSVDIRDRSPVPVDVIRRVGHPATRTAG